MQIRQRLSTHRLWSYLKVLHIKFPFHKKFFCIMFSWLIIACGTVLVSDRWTILEIAKDSKNKTLQRHSPRGALWKGVLENLAKFTWKHLASLFFNKVAVLRPSTLFKKRLWHRCFPVNFAKFLRTPFSQNTSGRLLLSVLIQKQTALKGMLN